ncbi:hypothetical protein N7501_008398 [Penicillium viridicatum]|nr:hypothetical protein N7501_008398 [Penicillium viridicatum]
MIIKRNDTTTAHGYLVLRASVNPNMASFKWLWGCFKPHKSSTPGCRTSHNHSSVTMAKKPTIIQGKTPPKPILSNLSMPTFQ